MTRKIFRSIFLTALVVFVVSMAVTVGGLYRSLASTQELRLQNALTLAARGVETGGTDYLRELDGGVPRLTLVGPDGEVLYDTWAQASAMENHADREEIRTAFESGFGQSARFSATLMEKTLYRAVRLENGTVLRASLSQATVLSLLTGIAAWLVLTALLSAVLSWLLARRLSERVITPLNQVDLDHPLSGDVYEELAPLLSRIQHQHEQIGKQLQQLRRKTDEFDQITASMKEGLVLLDARGTILSINPAAAALFGAGENAVGEDFLSVDRGREMDRAIAAALERGHVSLREDRGGRQYQFDLSRIESGGSTAGLVLLAVDVSDRETAERARREFTANVSHELKTPLTSILASSDLIQHGMVKPEDLPRFVGHIHQEASRLLSLIEDIIRLSQLDEGAPLEAEAVELGAVAAQAVEQLRDAARQRNVRLELFGEACVVHGAPQLLREIVYNLVENAVKYNVDGGSVEVSVVRTGGGCELRVADTGIGIPPEHQARVFERFYRVDQSHSKKSGGTGLGLSIVKHAAACFNAAVDLRSEPEKGTTVTVKFPGQKCAK